MVQLRKHNTIAPIKKKKGKKKQKPTKNKEGKEKKITKEREGKRKLIFHINYNEFQFQKSVWRRKLC